MTERKLENDFIKFIEENKSSDWFHPCRNAFIHEEGTIGQYFYLKEKLQATLKALLIYYGIS